MSEHLAIVCLSGFAILVQIINLKRPLPDVLWSLVALVLQMAVRLFFDLIVFCTEGQAGHACFSSKGRTLRDPID